MQFNFGDSYLNLHGILARVIVQSTSAVHISIKQFVHESSASSETPRMHSPSQLECNVLVYEALLRRRVEKKIAGDKNRRISKKFDIRALQGCTEIYSGFDNQNPPSRLPGIIQVSSKFFRTIQTSSEK
jgi:hypothetical protein